MQHENSIFGFAPEQNSHFHEFMDSLTFESQCTGKNPLNNNESTRIIFEGLSEQMTSSDEKDKDEAALITLGLCHHILRSNRTLPDSAQKTFFLACDSDPLGKYSLRKAHIDIMKSQIQDLQ